MQSAMLNESLLKHFVQWTSVRKMARSGCSFPDGSLLFDDEDEDGLFTNVKEVPKSADNNVYFYIDTPLFDPLEPEFEQYVLNFCNTTFLAQQASL